MPFEFISEARADELCAQRAGGADIRFYAVWGEVPVIPTGVHVGIQAGAYHGLLSLVGGNFGRVRFKRCPSKEEAIVFYLKQRKEARVVPTCSWQLQFYEWL